MLPTPLTSHLDFSAIYEPSEDSFLLLDSLSAPDEIRYLSRRFDSDIPSPLVLEVGTGSGVVLAFVAANAKTTFGREDVLTLGVDISERACKGTSLTVQKHASITAFLGTLQADLLSSIRPGSVDVLIFNPPYVPSESVPQVLAPSGNGSASSYEKFQLNSNLLALATDGGEDGMEVTNRLLQQIPSMLRVRGVAYVLLCAQNRPELVKQRIRDWGDGWGVETVRTSGMQGGWEKLQIIRIARGLSAV